MIVVDRIEGNCAVLEIDGQTMDVPLAELPAGIQEGQILQGDGDNSETGLPKSIVERVEQLRARDPGDIEIDI